MQISQHALKHPQTLPEPLRKTLRCAAGTGSVRVPEEAVDIFETMSALAAEYHAAIASRRMDTPPPSPPWAARVYPRRGRARTHVSSHVCHIT